MRKMLVSNRLGEASCSPESPEESSECEAVRAGDFIIGATPGVNDESAHLVREFVPTRYEVEELARHYLENARIIEFDNVALGSSGSYEVRFKFFAYKRIEGISKCIGREKVKLAVREVEDRWEERFRELERAQEEHRQTCDCGYPYMHEYDEKEHTKICDCGHVYRHREAEDEGRPCTCGQEHRQTGDGE